MMISAPTPPMFAGQLLQNAPLAAYTTWRVGGCATTLYKPHDIADVKAFLKSLPVDEPIYWLGLGSNALIRDKGIKGTVIVTQNCLKELSLIAPNLVYVEAGVSCATMARFCARQHLAGAEFWAGIPGTMGGALRMNAGCFNDETWNYVVEVQTIDRQGITRTRPKAAFEIGYREVNGLDADEWFVAATCCLPFGDKPTSLAKIKQLLAHRAATQPTSQHNCGSVFRNPPNQFAAKLIESCGLKGRRLGGAFVSDKHANFIINEGEASALDIENLIYLVKDEVKRQTQVDLTHEVHMLGEKT